MLDVCRAKTKSAFTQVQVRRWDSVEELKKLPVITTKYCALQSACYRLSYDLKPRAKLKEKRIGQSSLVQTLSME
jgi:hypothetical protein